MRRPECGGAGPALWKAAARASARAARNSVFAPLMATSGYTVGQNEGNASMTRLIAILFAAAAISAAQDKVTVPLSDPSQPATLRVKLISGSISVTAGPEPQVVVESSAGSRRVARGGA